MSIAVKSDTSLEDLLARVESLEGQVAASRRENRLCIVLFTPTYDGLLAALMMGTQAASAGMEVELFFTFWAVACLRDPAKSPKKDLMSRMFGWMMPRGMKKVPLSRMNMAGLGPKMMRKAMRKVGFPSLDELLAFCAELEIKFLACDLSREVMGIPKEELIDYPHLGHMGAIGFVERAAAGKVSLFI